jgi:hypothetical protein
LQSLGQLARAAGVVDVREPDLAEREPQALDFCQQQVRSPPGSMTAAWPVASHQTMEQFCWKGVTGTVR